MPENHLNALPQGSRIKEYEIVRVLGAGGFGITYLAFDHNLNGPVAIKEYFYAGLAVRRSDGAIAPGSTQRARDYEWGRARFLDEAQVLTKLNHPNVVRVRRYFQANNTSYIVMDYVEGDSLAAFLERRGKLTPAQWRPWLEALLDGLEHVHGHQYLHRDIKPENIVIRGNSTGVSQPVLIDFGAARRAAADKTLHLTAVHTPQYAPIEQYSTTGRQGPWTDIYSLAAVSYRVLAGEPPPNAADRIEQDKFKPLEQHLGRYPEALLAAIDHALAMRAADRPQDIATWRAGLTGTTGALLPPTGHSDESRKTVIEPDLPEVDLLQEEVLRYLYRLIVVFLTGIGVFTIPITLYMLAMRTDVPLWDSLYSLLVFLFYALIVTPAYAYYRRLYRELFERLRKGDANAQRTIGRAYYLGNVVTQDFAIATAWFRRAADQGDARAQYDLGLMYRRGYGVEKDASEAFAWLRKAAGQDLPIAQVRLGLMYAFGTGMARNTAEATALFRRAAINVMKRIKPRWA